MMSSESQGRADVGVVIAAMFGGGVARHSNACHIQFQVEVTPQRVTRSYANTRHRHGGRQHTVAEMVVIAAPHVIETQQAQTTLLQQLRRVEFSIDERTA